MLDYGDPCSAVGRLSCGGCQTDDVDDSVSLLAASTWNSRGTDKSGPSHDHVASLKKRVSTFQSKGWLSQQEHRKYMALLSTGPAAKENSSGVKDHVLKELEKELNTLEYKMTGGKKQSTFSRLAESANRTTSGFHMFTQSRSTTPFAPITNQAINERLDQSIVLPKFLSKELNEDQISELFVETCFFARLGFVQPPCCMQCTYRESMKEAIPNTKCTRWVIWRRDANHVLHPHHLCDNAIAVRCHTARKLLAGKTVGSYRWDKYSKKLIQPRTMKPFVPSTMRTPLK